MNSFLNDHPHVLAAIVILSIAVPILLALFGGMRDDSRRKHDRK